MRLSGTGLSTYEFEHLELVFTEGQVTNLFALKNNKTLRQTVEHPRYIKLRNEAYSAHERELDKPLGQFLLDRKLHGDLFYKRFLNRYGDDTYSTFRMSQPSSGRSRGIYAYVVQGQILYVGRCRDAISKRVNHGYGKIHPKNYYLDGQATNCHLNSRITKEKTVEFWFCQIESLEEIVASERELIRFHSPPWNLQLCA